MKILSQALIYFDTVTNVLKFGKGVLQRNFFKLPSSQGPVFEESKPVRCKLHSVLTILWYSVCNV